MVNHVIQLLNVYSDLCCQTFLLSLQSFVASIFSYSYILIFKIVSQSFFQKLMKHFLSFFIMTLIISLLQYFFLTRTNFKITLQTQILLSIRFYTMYVTMDLVFVIEYLIMQCIEKNPILKHTNSCGTHYKRTF